MKRLRWWRITLLLIVLILVAAALNFCVRRSGTDNHFMDTSALPPMGADLQPASIANDDGFVSKEKRRAMVERVRMYAAQAAKASGQTQDEAKQFAVSAAAAAEEALSKAMSKALIPASK